MGEVHSGEDETAWRGDDEAFVAEGVCTAGQNDNGKRGSGETVLRTSRRQPEGKGMKGLSRGNWESRISEK
jgi:hypothetical protein